MIATSPRQFLRSVGFPGYRRRQSLEASYDAASYSGLMDGAWVNADSLSADQANNPGVRQTLRSRSRYECLEANSFLRGAITTVVDCLIGRGPRLQMQFRQEQMPPGVDAAELNRKIEALFSRWSKAARYGEYLRTLVRSRIVDGEGYGLRTTSRTIPWDLPQLFCRNVEAERFTSLATSLTGDRRVDGMRIDSAGEVVSYFVNTSTDEFYSLVYTEIPRSDVTHLFRRERPGQHHGIPELTTSLPLCNLLRQYTLATVTAARTAAKHAGLLQTQASAVTADGTAMDDISAFDSEEVDYDMLTALPKGWQLVQMRAEQPTTTYEMFRDCLLGEIVRPLGAPLNIVLGSSAKWNYASTQADQVTFANRNRIERHEIEVEECDRTFSAWWDEALLIPDLIPNLCLLRGRGSLVDIPHCWFWDGLPDADPQTLATARQINLQTGHSSREEELAKAGIDIDSHDEHAAKSLGLTVTEFRQTIARKLFDSATIDSVRSSSTGGAPVAMNGAQLQSLTQVATAVSTGQMKPAIGREVVIAAFPSISLDQVSRMFPDSLAVEQASQPPAVSAASHRRSITGYSPDQERADNGQFGSGGGSSSGKLSSSSDSSNQPTEAQTREKASETRARAKETRTKATEAREKAEAAQAEANIKADAHQSALDAHDGSEESDAALEKAASESESAQTAADDLSSEADDLESSADELETEADDLDTQADEIASETRQQAIDSADEEATIAEDDHAEARQDARDSQREVKAAENRAKRAKEKADKKTSEAREKARAAREKAEAARAEAVAAREKADAEQAKFDALDEGAEYDDVELTRTAKEAESAESAADDLESDAVDAEIDADDTRTEMASLVNDADADLQDAQKNHSESLSRLESAKQAAVEARSRHKALVRSKR